MTTTPLSGAFAPVPTPLSAAGEFDGAALTRHLAWLGERGLDGALILGSNGEFPSLTLDERRAVAEAAAAAACGLDLILGVGGCALPEVLAMVEVAGRFDYSAVLVPPPFYFPAPPASGLASFFKTVLDAATPPVLLYNIPQTTGIPIDDRLLDELADHPRLAGVKDSSGNLAEMDRLLGRFDAGSYLVGNDRLISRCLAAGGTGSISAAASVVPTLVASLTGSPENQSILDGIRTLLENHGLVPSVKAILRGLGLGDYAARPPLADLDADEADAVFKALEALLPMDRW